MRRALSMLARHSLHPQPRRELPPLPALAQATALAWPASLARTQHLYSTHLLPHTQPQALPRTWRRLLGSAAGPATPLPPTPSPPSRSLSSLRHPTDTHDKRNLHVTPDTLDTPDTHAGPGGDLPETDPRWAAVVELLGAMAAAKGRPPPAAASGAGGGGGGGGGWRDAYEYMPVHMQRVGITPDALARLNVLHVAGTKGKGSTCAMLDACLRAAGYRTALFTSPHLVDVRERIRLNGEMLPRADFAAAFWHVYGALKAAAERDEQQAREAEAAQPGQAGRALAPSPAAPSPGVAVGMPGFFSFMTILALHVFLSRPPSSAPHAVILEVGIGGRLDATNAAAGAAPAATAITSLGFDHMELLGNTLAAIAREKAGIMKRGRPVLTVPQPEEAMQALLEAAARAGAVLSVPPPLDAYRLRPADAMGQQAAQGPGAASSSSAAAASLHLGVGGAHMRTNAALAVALAAEWEATYAAAAAAGQGQGHGEGHGAVEAAAAARCLPPGGPPAAEAAARAAAVREARVLPAEYAAALRGVTWPGRSQVIPDPHVPHLTWYLDGAHTPESLAAAGAWFGQRLRAAREAAGGEGARHSAALLFNCMRDRDPAALLPALGAALAPGAPGAAAGSGPGGQSGPAAAGPGADRVALASVLFTPMLSGGGVLLPPGGGAAASPSPPPAGGGTAAADGPAAAAAAAAPDLSWQERMAVVWAAAPECAAAMGPSAAAAGAAGGGAEAAPTTGGTGRARAAAAAAVAASLPAALDALRAAAAAAQAGTGQPEQRHHARGGHTPPGAVQPHPRLHVLVTGSLYLVGDVLRLLGRRPE